MNEKTRDEILDIIREADKKYLKAHIEALSRSENLLIKDYRDWLLHELIREMQYIKD